MSLPSAVGYWEHCETDGPDDYLCARWGDFATVHMRAGRDPSRCTRIEWTSTFAREIEDCYDLDPNVHWYGGGEMFTQIWPIETRPRQEGPYITADSMADNEGQFGGVLENYWLLSSGATLIIDPDTPLYFSLNSTHPNKVCFVSRDHTPYTKRSPLTMNYEWCTGTNIKDAHQFTMSTFFEKPTGIPDEEMLIRPLWSTWAEYKVDVNQSIVLDFARKVVSEGFGNSSHIEIDDHWETCYGEEVFDPAKFPNPREMVDEIKDMNMRVTMWVHPFVNYGKDLVYIAYSSETNGLFRVKILIAILQDAPCLTRASKKATLSKHHEVKPESLPGGKAKTLELLTLRIPKPHSGGSTV